VHAVVVTVTVKDRQAAEGELRELVPRISSAPDFVAGYWVATPDGHGHSIAVFESEDAAKAVAGQVRATNRDAVEIDSVQVGEVVAHG
jgi:hypothetical protein